MSLRLNTLARCIENVFEILPPDRTSLPEREELLDATINIHAFAFGLFRRLDNFAWQWISECNLTQKDGTLTPYGWMGLTKKPFRPSIFHEGFSNMYLNSLDDWFDHLEHFRHALAHISLFLHLSVHNYARQGN